MHSLLISIIVGTVFMCAVAGAQETWLVGGKPVKKVEALVSLVREPGVEVVKCVHQELTDKGTMRNKKAVR